MRHVSKTIGTSLGHSDGNQIIHTNSKKFKNHSSHTLGRKDTVIMRKLSLVLGAIALCGFITANASAKSVNQAILDTGVSVGDNVQLVIQDSDASLVLDDGDNTIGVGEYIVGTLEISEFTIQPDGGSVSNFDVGTNGVNELTGIYALEVLTASASQITAGAVDSAGAAAIESALGLSSGFLQWGFGNGAIVALFDDAALDYDTAVTLSTNGFEVPTTLDIAGATNGTPWMSFGDDGNLGGATPWTITDDAATNVTDIRSLVQTFGAAGVFADVSFNLNQILNSSSVIDFAVNPASPDLQQGGIANTLSGIDNVTGGLVSSDLSFRGQATVIPLPSAVWAGLVLMGGLPIARRFRRRGADL